MPVTTAAALEGAAFKTGRAGQPPAWKVRFLRRVVAGFVFRVERRRGSVWYAKYRLLSGRQVQKLVGPAWTERGRPPAGYLSKCTAEALDAPRRAALGLPA